MAAIFNPDDQEHRDWRARIAHLVDLELGWREVDLTESVDVTEHVRESA